MSECFTPVESHSQVDGIPSHSLELRKLFGRLELGGLLVPDESQQPFFFHLHNLEEAWDDTWYNKENLPTMKDML